LITFPASIYDKSDSPEKGIYVVTCAGVS